ncbi:hypothetical protein, partial [Streptococcus sp. DD11]|uniref:hypothetical protein n=1 Tax=Streptococcus sp. DD11 TaxID=1777879 RepID=UPI0019D0B204
MLTTLHSFSIFYHSPWKMFLIAFEKLFKAHQLQLSGKLLKLTPFAEKFKENCSDRSGSWLRIFLLKADPLPNLIAFLFSKP